jgi:hypothetical protein
MQYRSTAQKSLGSVLVSLVECYLAREEPVLMAWVIEASKEDLEPSEWMGDHRSVREDHREEADLSEGQLEVDLLVVAHEARKDYSPYSLQ